MLPIVIQLLLGLLLRAVSHPQATRTPRPPRVEEPTLAVETFNLNYARAGDAATLAALAETTADLLFLQETNRRWQGQVQPQLAARYPYQRWIEGSRAGGQAVLARRPFTLRQVIPSPTGWFPAVWVVAETALGPVQVLAVHLHPQITEQGSWIVGHFATDAARLREMRRYLSLLKEPLPTLIAGDFNEGTDGATLQLLAGRGFRSALPEFAPEATTWHWSVGGLELSAQLDHLLYDPWFMPLDAAVVRAGSSDHFPVRALFTSAKPRLR